MSSTFFLVARIRRYFRARAVIGLAAAGMAAGGAIGLACGSSNALGGGGADASADSGGGIPYDGSLDGGIITPFDAGPPPTCAQYCAAVMTNCTGANAQYASADECKAICALIDPGQTGDKTENSIACRYYYAGTPSLTTPGTSCLAAGPFGGEQCGTRCADFCALAIAACPADAGGPYGSAPECSSECANYVFVDGGVEAGGESPTGPDHGDSLNCREHALREAIASQGSCRNIGEDSGTCN